MERPPSIPNSLEPSSLPDNRRRALVDQCPFSVEKKESENGHPGDANVNKPSIPWKVFAFPFIWNLCQIVAGFFVFLAARHTQSIWTLVYALEVPVTLVFLVRYVNKFKTPTTAISYLMGLWLQCWLGTVWAARVVIDTFNPLPQYYEGMSQEVHEAAWRHHDQTMIVSLIIWAGLMISGALGIGSAQCILMVRQAKRLAAQADPAVQI